MRTDNTTIELILQTFIVAQCRIFPTNQLKGLVDAG
jgi:hypothetical protein